MKKIILLLLIILPMESALSTPKKLALDGFDWKFRFKNETKTYPATVPGSSYNDMIENEIIKDPYIGANSLDIEWVDKTSFVYTKTFLIDALTLEKEFQEIVFEGLNTHASVKLNGIEILEANNFNRKFFVNVKEKLKVKNVIEIIFDTVEAYNEKVKNRNYKEIMIPADSDARQPFSRNPNFNYGWDFAMKALGPAIHKSIYLHFFCQTYISEFTIATERIIEGKGVDILLRTELFHHSKLDISSPHEKKSIFVNKRLHKKPREAKFEIEEIEIRNLHKKVEKPTKFNLHFKISNHDSGLLAYEKKFQLSAHLTLSESLEVNGVKLWWPQSHGNQHLYDFSLDLYFEQELIDSKNFISGFKTSALIQKRDSIGESFYFVINGKDVYSKGANVVPIDIFTRTNRDDYIWRLVKSAKEANFNMVRVWGGGNLMPPLFYQLCDKYGILVFQDFLFANEMYPGKSDFIENITPEIIGNIKELRNYVSLTHWNGNNEIMEAWLNWGLQGSLSKENQGTLEYWYDRIFLLLIPKLLEEYDGFHSYTDTSPRYGWGHKESLEIGDSHSWWVWVGGQEISSYLTMIPRFSTEFGMQAFPALSSMKKFLSESQLILNSPELAVHQKHATGFPKLYSFLEQYFFFSLNFSYTIYLSQLLQAYTVRTAVEGQRSSSSRCMGTLYWQMNDAWPAISWSSLDYYGTKKALLYDSKRFFSPIFLFFDQIKREIVIVSEKMDYKRMDASLRLALIDFKGGLPLSEITIPLKIEDFSEKRIKFHEVTEISKLKSPSTFYLYMELSFEGKVISDNFAFFVKPKELEIDLEPTVNFQIKDQHIKIKSDVFLYGVYIFHDDIDLDLSDNFFHLQAGEKKIIPLKALLKNKEEGKIKFLTLNKVKKTEKSNKLKFSEETIDLNEN